MEGFVEKVLGFLVLSAALAGCAVIDKHEPVPGWPELKVVEHHVTAEEVVERCQPYAPRFSVPEACTLFYLQHGEAHIYVRKDFPLRWVLEHERLHAAGYDHVGSTAMQRMLETWKAGTIR
jgi:hypothetical protein